MRSFVKLNNEARENVRFVFCFKRIVNEREEEMLELEMLHEILGALAREAIRLGEDIPVYIAFWEEVVYKLIQENTKTKLQTCCFGYYPKYIWLYKREEQEMIKRLIKIGNEYIRFIHHRPDAPCFFLKGFIFCKSMESEYKKLWSTLIFGNNFITVLQGIGGIGKTMLARKMGALLMQYGRFTRVVLTCVSFTPDIKKIQDDIAGPLDLKLKDYNESDRSKKLWSRLTNGEKILLIMDDVWDEVPLDFAAIGIPDSDNHKGCRLLVTSRSKQIFDKMECVERIELGLLSEEDAWIMFQYYAGISNSSSNDVISKGRVIAKECKQLPLAISIIARRLKDQQLPVHEWDTIIKPLMKYAFIPKVDDDMTKIDTRVKISYDNMKDEKAKRLFLLCSVFGKDEEISVEILTRLCIGAGLFGEDYCTYGEARNLVVAVKNKLLDSSLLLEIDEKRVMMQDLVCDVAQSIKDREIQKSFVERKVDIKYPSCEGKDVDLLSSKSDDSKLEILFVNVDRDEDRKCMEVPNSFFENMAKLRVLYILAEDDDTPLSLPYSIQSLTNIRSILVNSVDLGDISVLGKLQSLETLDLVECTINQLPKEIAKLEKLKLLNLESCVIKMDDPFEVIKRCSSLQELYFIDSFNGVCGEIALPELRRYHICKGWVEMNNWISKCVVFPTNGDAYRFSKETLIYCMQTAEVLRLNGIKGKWRNLMPEIVPTNLGMNDLVKLCLSCDSKLQFLVDATGYQMPNVFSKLVVLKLDRMENLEDLFNGALSIDCLKNLKKVSIKDCKRLQSLFKCKLNLFGLKVIELQSCPRLVSLFSQRLTSGSLALLETLKIAHCESLKNIIVDERIEEESSNEWYGSMFPKLKVLDIEGCPLLASIFPLLFFQDLPVLQTLQIRRCDGLKYIFGKYQHVEFCSLKQLELCHLPNFIAMFRESKLPISSSANESSNQPQDNSVALASESNSYFLNIWERAKCIQIQSKILYNIKKIELSEFSEIKSVFILSIVPKLLLESLTIRNCDELEHIIDFGDYDSGSNNWGSIFPKLKELYIEGCAQLKYILGRDTLDQQNHIKILLNLPRLEFLSLRNLPSLVAMCPKKYHTTFPPSAKLELVECPKATIKSIGNFIMNPLSESLDNTIIKEYGDDQIAIPSPSISTKESLTGEVEGSQETNQIKNLGALNDNAFMKVSSTTEQQFPKDDASKVNYT
ncbi:probable disease resistance protein At4g27220 [Lathyrus oleraceus]|uniref:NB-ARC domain-containing protein n=2 Tax=Pisum sativum TaxID=3888 RepID=A0A9D4WXK1_PEA|nr:probable disease resistance protein At4g27220 [Pisum sativum]KAI5408421.1 hypothetical protein KIW84_054304 [Pisum sativum]